MDFYEGGFWRIYVEGGFFLLRFEVGFGGGYFLDFIVQKCWQHFAKYNKNPCNIAKSTFLCFFILFNALQNKICKNQQSTFYKNKIHKTQRQQRLNECFKSNDIIIYQTFLR
ncbi:hypothetical protein [Helicobacter sp. T3_23-1059]